MKKYSAGLVMVLVALFNMSACGGTPAVSPTATSPSPIPLATTTRPAATPTVAPQPSKEGLTTLPTPSPQGGLTAIPATPTRVPVTPTTTAPKPSVTVVPGRGQPIQWSETRTDLIVGMSFDPYPPKMGTTTTFKVILTDAAGQPVSDATIELSVTAGMAGMQGEHDDTSNLSLTNQGDGVYATRASVGQSDQLLTGMTFDIQRGEKRWAFVISKDELPPR